jgi:hypothetical protein
MPDPRRDPPPDDLAALIRQSQDLRARSRLLCIQIAQRRLEESAAEVESWLLAASAREERRLLREAAAHFAAEDAAAQLLSF